MCTVRLAADGGDERRGVAAREPPALGVLQREGDVRAVAAAAAALRALAEAAQPGPERPEAALRAVAVALLRGSRRAGELRKAAALRLGRVRGGRAEARLPARLRGDRAVPHRLPVAGKLRQARAPCWQAWVRRAGGGRSGADGADEWRRVSGCDESQASGWPPAPGDDGAHEPS